MFYKKKEKKKSNYLRNSFKIYEQVSYLAIDGTERYKEALNQMCSSIYMF